MSLAEDIVDEITADLVANASLGQRTIFKYLRPRTIAPQECPALVVRVGPAELGFRTTQRAEREIRIIVSWHWESTEEAEQLEDLDAEGVAALDALEKIENRLIQLAIAGLTLQPAYELTPIGSRTDGADLLQGLVRGVAAEANVRAGMI